MWNCLELAWEEDCHYGDITTEMLGIKGEGRLRFLSRTEAVISGTERLKDFMVSKQVKVLAWQKAGAKIVPGDIILEAEGNLAVLFKLWRICQTYLTVLCAIATETAKVVQEAKKYNPDIKIVVACRKAHLGMRKEEIEAVSDGGAVYHRNSLSDTILITQNHLRMLGELPDKLYSFHHNIEVEPTGEDEAMQWAKLADIILLDHFSGQALASLSQKLKKVNPRLKVGVAGGITLATVQNFAPYVDLIVLSSVLYAQPLDFTCKIERI